VRIDTPAGPAAHIVASTPVVATTTEAEQKVIRRVTGFAVSLVLHVVILVVLALMFTQVDKPARVVLELAFALPEPLLPAPVADVEVEIADEPAAEPAAPAEEVVEAAEPEQPAEPEPMIEEPVPPAEPVELVREDVPGMEAADDEPAQAMVQAAPEAADVVVAPLEDGPPPPLRAARRARGNPPRFQPQAVDASDAAHGGGGGGDKDFDRRLNVAGAKTGDIQISLLWDNVHDVDLHVIAPSGEHIMFAHRGSRCGGLLDVDMNVFPQTARPVENVFWPPRGAPPGEYEVYVHHYQFHVGPDPTPFRVRIIAGGRKAIISGQVSAGQPPVRVARFRHDGTGLPGE
jgi:hypothetical protein